MKHLKFNLLLLSILVAFIVTDAQSQEFFKLQSNTSKLIVAGTSSLHDWKMEAGNFNAETLIKLEGNAVSEISKIEFLSPVAELKSGKRLMDSKAHEALQEKNFPEIKFTLKENGHLNISGDKASMTGILSIAGKTREVQLDVDFNHVTARRFLVSGSVPLKMSDFGIDPPTAMMGAMKTNDEVVVKFDLEFQRSSETYTRNF